jgi:hypothetical protein
MSKAALTVFAVACVCLQLETPATAQSKAAMPKPAVRGASDSPYAGGHAQGRKEALALRAKGIYEWLVAGPPPSAAQDQALHEVYGKYGIRIRYVGDVLYPGMSEYMTAFMQVMDDALIQRYGKDFPEQIEKEYGKRHAELQARPLSAKPGR